MNDLTPNHPAVEAVERDQQDRDDDQKHICQEIGADAAHRIVGERLSVDGHDLDRARMQERRNHDE